MRRLRPLCAAAVLAVAALLAACDDAPPRPRQAQTVKLLPDTPPPPPPPPKPEDKRPEPRKEDRPQPLPQPKPEPVQAQLLKSDEAAGQGPGNGLTSGAVAQDYSGGAVGNAVQVGGGTPEVGAQRLAASAYANAATRALNEYLVREKDLKQQDWRVQVHVWLQPDGSLQRAELMGSTGSADLDDQLRRALERFPGTRAPLPERMPLPLRLQLSNRMMG